MGVITTKFAVGLVALGAMACAAAPKLVPPGRAPLRPAEECAEVRARVDRGELVAGRDSVFAPTITRFDFVDPRPYGRIPAGTLVIRFFVSTEGRVERETLVVTGHDGHPYHDAQIREILGSRFYPAVLENCAVRSATTITLSSGVRR